MVALLRLAILTSVLARGDVDPELNAINLDAACARVAGFVAGISPTARADIEERGLDEELRECGSDARCISTRLEARQIDLAALVVVNLATTPPLLTMRLVSTDGGRVLSERASAVPKNVQIKDAVSAEFAVLLERGGHPVLGRVNVDAAPANAIVRIESARESLAGSVFLLPPGEHRVSIDADGYAETSTAVRVERMRESQLVLALEPESSVFGEWWFWMIVGGAAVAASASAFFMLREEDGLTLCHAGCVEE